jgi:hypothetical protein
LETLLRAYIAEDKMEWARWLRILEFSYNSNIHSSTGMAHFFLLYGFDQKAPLDYFLPKDWVKSAPTGMRQDSSAYLEQLRVHHESARLAIARAQNEQAKYFN